MLTILMYLNFIEVYLEYSDELHVWHNDYPLKELAIPNDMLSDYC